MIVRSFSMTRPMHSVHCQSFFNQNERFWLKKWVTSPVTDWFLFLFSFFHLPVKGLSLARVGFFCLLVFCFVHFLGISRTLCILGKKLLASPLLSEAVLKAQQDHWGCHRHSPMAWLQPRQQQGPQQEPWGTGGAPLRLGGGCSCWPGPGWVNGRKSPRITTR